MTDLLPLSSNEGHEYIIQVRFRAQSADVANDVAMEIQETAPDAGVQVLCHTDWSPDAKD